MDTKQDLYEDLDDETIETLERNGFEAERFLQLRRDFLAGRLSEEANRLEGEIEAPGPDDLDVLPSRESVEGQRLIRIGEQAIREGKVGVCILNGGMATRFGGAVKGCVEVFDGRSFLELKLRDAARWDGAVDVLVMNSFNTDDVTREHLVGGEYFGCDGEDVFLFTQNASIRLTPDGELFRDEQGEVSLYPPGHGDLAEALNRGVLERFVDGGGEYLMMSNVDNLFASIDPLVVGSHVQASRSGAEMTIEAVKSEPGDAGGKPARVDGKLRIVESFQFPEPFPYDAIPVHNTNTLTFDAESLQQEFDLNWYVVDKEVEGQTVIQFERLAGELSAELDSHVLSVPREGESSRFQPVKTRDDLDDNRDFMRRIMGNRDIV